MKQIFLLCLFIILMRPTHAQQSNDFFVPQAISFETQMIVRGEENNRGGIGMNLIVGSVHRIHSRSRFRFSPTIEMGTVSWPNENDENPTNSYASLNLEAHFDLIRIQNFSIPITAGFIFDGSFKRDEPVVFNRAVRFGFACRIESRRSPNAFEFLKWGITVTPNISQGGRGIGAFYFGILKVEHKF